MVQFLIHSDNCYAKCLEPKGFPKKKIRVYFLKQGSKIKTSKVEKMPQKAYQVLDILKMKNFCFLDHIYFGLYFKGMAVIMIFLSFLNFVFLSTL